MPRRRPVQLRARRDPLPGCSIPQVRGVSAATARAIADLERARLRPGAVAEALAGWSAFVHGPKRAFDGYAPEDCPCEGCQWDDPAVRRETLAIALSALPRQAARELRAVVRPLDETYLSRSGPGSGSFEIRRFVR